MFNVRFTDINSRKLSGKCILFDYYYEEKLISPKSSLGSIFSNPIGFSSVEEDGIDYFEERKKKLEGK